MKTENIIKASAINVLNLIIRSLIEHCYLLSQGREISFTKGVFPEKSISKYDDKGFIDWTADLLVLDLVEDKPVVYLLNMIRKIQRYILQYEEQNDFDWEEVANDYYVMVRSATTWSNIIGDFIYDNYLDILESLSWVVECYGVVIWNLAYQQILNRNDVFLETELEFYAWDGDVDILDIEDENASSLLKIYADIQLDSASIEEYKSTYNGKI